MADEDGCLSGQAKQVGTVLPGEYALLMQYGPEYILAGNNTRSKFIEAMVRDHGERVRPYAKRLWINSSGIYEQAYKGVPGAPGVVREISDYLPDYKYPGHIYGGVFEAEILKSIEELAASNELTGYRGGYERKPREATRLEATKRILSEGYLDDPGKLVSEVRARVRQDVLVSTLNQLTGEAANDMLEAKSRIENLQLQIVAASGIADPTQRQATLDGLEARLGEATLHLGMAQDIMGVYVGLGAGEATATGRALNMLKDRKRLLNAGTTSAAAFSSLFGAGNPRTAPARPSNAQAQTEAESITPQTKAQTQKPKSQRKKNIASAGITSAMFPEFKTTQEGNSAVSEGLLDKAKRRVTNARKRALEKAPEVVKELDDAKGRLRSALSKYSGNAYSTPVVIPPEVAMEVVNVAKAHIKLGIRVFSEFRAILKEEYGLDHPEVAVSWQKAGGTLTKAEQAELAKDGSRQVDRLKAMSGQSSPSGVGPAKPAELEMGLPMEVRTSQEQEGSLFGKANETEEARAKREMLDTQGAKPAVTAREESGAPGEFKSGPGLRGTDVQAGMNTELAKNAVSELGTKAKNLVPVKGSGEVTSPGQLDTEVELTRLEESGAKAGPATPARLSADAGSSSRQSAIDPLGSEAASNRLQLNAGKAAGSSTVGTGEVATPEGVAGEVPYYEKTLYDTATGEALKKRLSEVYVSPGSPGRDPATVETLKSYGGYTYEKLAKELGKRPDWYTWVVEMKATTGKDIEFSDLAAAWDLMKEHAFKNKVKPQKDIRSAAMRRAGQILNPTQLAEAKKLFSQIDPKAKDAHEKYRDAIESLRQNEPVEYLREIPSFLRAIKTSFDVSAAFMQGSLYTLNPMKSRQTVGNMRDMLKAFGDDNYAQAAMADIMSGPNVELYEQFGNGMFSKFGADVKVLEHEEAFATRVFDTIAEASYDGGKTSVRFKSPFKVSDDGYVSLDYNPGRAAARGVRASERGYTVYLNLQRKQAFDSGVKLLQGRGMMPDTHPQSYQALADIVGDFTGRGTFGKLEKTNFPTAMSWLLFSPRFQWSRLKVLGYAPRIGLSAMADKAKWDGSVPESLYVPKELRGMVAQDLAGAVAGLGIVLTLAMASGAEINLDPQHKDFLRARYRDMTLDFSGGMAGWMRFFAQTGYLNLKGASFGMLGADPQTISTRQNRERQGIRMPGNRSGMDVRALDGEYGNKSVFDIVQQTIVGKMNPVAKVGVEMATGRDNFTGDPKFTGRFRRGASVKAVQGFGNDLLREFAPLTPYDIVSAAFDKDYETGEKVLSTLAMFGVNTKATRFEEDKYKEKQK